MLFSLCGYRFFSVRSWKFLRRKDVVHSTNETNKILLCSLQVCFNDSQSRFFLAASRYFIVDLSVCCYEKQRVQFWITIFSKHCEFSWFKWFVGRSLLPLNFSSPGQIRCTDGLLQWTELWVMVVVYNESAHFLHFICCSKAAIVKIWNCWMTIDLVFPYPISFLLTLRLFWTSINGSQWIHDPKLIVCPVLTVDGGIKWAVIVLCDTAIK